MSAVTRHQVFSAVHTVGGLLPVDMLVRISEGKDVEGAKPADYRVVGSRSVRDEAERHWDFLRSVWRELRSDLPRAREEELPTDPTGRAASQWLAPLFAELGFGQLTPLGETGITADDGAKTFPVTHRWTHVPVHLAAWHHSLDKRPGGAGTVPPQSLVQECLNRTDGHLWGVLTNGRQLRLLRDSSALATASYVEFDLEAIFDGELFSEFVLLYRLLHASRFAVAEDQPPSACWLETWRSDAITSGTRALDQLRDGVQQAITTLGTGFLRHPDNAALRDDVDVAALHNALLRLAYRMIFLFVAEDREVLHPEGTSDEARRRYATYFSTARLRAHARRRRGTAHDDLYRSLRLVLDALGSEDGLPQLELAGLGGIFDDTEADTPLRGLSLSNEYLLTAVRQLSRVRQDTRWRPVNYRGMGSEELGSVYESLLELVPRHSVADREFTLVDRLGNDRKKTGSYYTPASLIETLLNSSLDPVIKEAWKRGEQRASADGAVDPAEHIVAELLSLTVCDPACGSGHFLVAAARRIAKQVAAVREHNPEPTVDAVREALHEVVGRCLYGVDLNPMAVELAKVALWLEALTPGRPLSFLDARLKHGNGLIGATPALLRDGIPSSAFKPIEGDEKSHARALGKRNDAERAGQGVLIEWGTGTIGTNRELAAEVRRIIDAPNRTLPEVRRAAADYRQWEDSDEYTHARTVADAWCAAILWHKHPDAPEAITQNVFLALQADADSPEVPEETRAEITRLREQYRFFHWHLAFPHIFTVPEDAADADPATGWSGGFSCVLANPPWDKVDFEDKKYFSVVEPSIAAMTGAARRERIAEWQRKFPEEGRRYRAARRAQKGMFHFAGNSLSFPLCAKGLTVKGVTMLQVDQLFAERFTAVVAPTGRVGCIIPTAIATGAGGQHLFGDFVRRKAVTALYDFEVRGSDFEGVHSSYKFCLLSLVGAGMRSEEPNFAFFVQNVTDLDKSDRTFTLHPADIELINPNTGTLPSFRKRRDADLTTAVYSRLPVLWDERKREGNHWNIQFVPTMFHMTDDSDVFRTRDALEKEGWELRGNVFVRGADRMLPLYEAKMVDFFNHRSADVVKSETAVNRQNQPQYLDDSALDSPARAAIPANWVHEYGTVEVERKGKKVNVSGVERRLSGIGWVRDWLCGWCDVTSSTNERTAIPAFLPRVAVGHTFPLMLSLASPDLVAGLVAAQSSLVFDFVSRQKVGSNHMALMTWKQLPVPSPTTLRSHTPFLTPRVLELVYTAHDMAGLAQDLDDDGPPFRWDEDRRARIRAELDAYFFHLYGIAGEDVDYILETFQTESKGGLKYHEIAKYGTFRTKDLVLAEYDRMAEAGVDLDTPLVDGENYTSTLTPPPGHGPRHPARSNTAEPAGV